jgi:hypothetical protein
MKKRSASELPGLPPPPEGWVWAVTTRRRPEGQELYLGLKKFWLGVIPVDAGFLRRLPVGLSEGGVQRAAREIILDLEHEAAIRRAVGVYE